MEGGLQYQPVPGTGGESRTEPAQTDRLGSTCLYEQNSWIVGMREYAIICTRTEDGRGLKQKWVWLTEKPEIC